MRRRLSVSKLRQAGEAYFSNCLLLRVHDRSSVHEKRDPKEIGIASVRGGSIVGDHDVIFAGKDEVITFNHTAYSKAIFAKGALEAAKFLAGKEPGLYDMSDVVQL